MDPYYNSQKHLLHSYKRTEALCHNGGPVCLPFENTLLTGTEHTGNESLDLDIVDSRLYFEKAFL